MALGPERNTNIANKKIFHYDDAYIKQHLSNLWSSFHEIVKEHWGWAEKKGLLMKKGVYSCYFANLVKTLRATDLDITLHLNTNLISRKKITKIALLWN